MNDDFMIQLREAPRAEFADALYQQLSRQRQPYLAQALAQRLTLRNAAIVFALLFFVAACVYVVSESRWDKVGNIHVQRMYTLDYSPPEEPEIVIPDDECFSVEEAKQILRFDLKVPTWVPEGFIFDERICRPRDSYSDFVYFYLVGPDKNTRISMTLSNLKTFNIATQKYEITSPILQEFVKPGSYEEVQVKGQSAVLVHGDWEAPWRTVEMLNQKHEYKWDKERAIQLYWVDGGVFYQLYTQTDLSPEEVIKIAESTR